MGPTLTVMPQLVRNIGYDRDRSAMLAVKLHVLYISILGCKTCWIFHNEIIDIASAVAVAPMAKPSFEDVALGLIRLGSPKVS